MAGLTTGVANGMFRAAWGRVGEAVSGPVRHPIFAVLAPWLLAAIVAVPLAFIVRALVLDYGFYPPVYSHRPLEVLGLWLLCYWGVMAARWLWRQMQG